MIGHGATKDLDHKEHSARIKSTTPIAPIDSATVLITTDRPVPVECYPKVDPGVMRV
jgi:hypothetical protein